MKTAPETDPTGDEQQATIMLWIVASMLVLVLTGLVWRLFEWLVK